jgi:hypothetical protein
MSLLFAISLLITFFITISPAGAAVTFYVGSIPVKLDASGESQKAPKW